MSVYSTFKRTVNGIFSRFGYLIVRYEHLLNSLELAFARLASRPVAISTVIDVGASDGRWSEMIRPYYPQARYMLIEANAIHEPGLKQYKQRHPTDDYVLAAAGDYEGEIYFNMDDPFGGVASHEDRPGYKSLPVTTIDTQVHKRNLQPPFLIKLDTHGFEVPILEGATKTLAETNMLVIEVYNFQIEPASLRFHEMCSFMEAKGFRPVDLISPLYRPKDDALWQFDLLFIRADRPEFQYNAYE